jgi:hypothetical protein
MATKLKAPFPAFGGKAKVAPLVWQRLGNVDNFIEPFCNSAAVLLQRQHPPRIETINDWDCYTANFWRATKYAAEKVAEYADNPVNEADLHARHRYLMLGEDAADFRARMRTEPEYFDARIAGWWVWGSCCWIGSGWCVEKSVSADGSQTSQALPLIGLPNGRGILRKQPISLRPRIGHSSQTPIAEGAALIAMTQPALVRSACYG